MALSKGLHLGKRLVNQPHIGGINQVVCQHRGIHQQCVAFNNLGRAQVGKDAFFNLRDSLFTQSLTEAT